MRDFAQVDRMRRCYGHLRTAGSQRALALHPTRLRRCAGLTAGDQPRAAGARTITERDRDTTSAPADVTGGDRRFRLMVEHISDTVTIIDEVPEDEQVPDYPSPCE